MRELKRIVEGNGREDRDVPRHQRRARPAADGRLPDVSRTAARRWSRSSQRRQRRHARARPLRLASGGEELDEKCNVPVRAAGTAHRPDATPTASSMPSATTRRGRAGHDRQERGRLLDAMSDMHQYFHGKRVAVAGDPDHVIALTQFLVELDMKPAYVITGSPGKHFEARVARNPQGPRARRDGEAERRPVRAAPMDQATSRWI